MLEGILAAGHMPYCLWEPYTWAHRGYTPRRGRSRRPTVLTHALACCTGYVRHTGVRLAMAPDAEERRELLSPTANEVAARPHSGIGALAADDSALTEPSPSPPQVLPIG